jgi:hypothetical protein
MNKTEVVITDLSNEEFEEADVAFEDKTEKAMNFLANIEDELSSDVAAQVKNGLQDFTLLLTDLKLDPKLASLWKLIYSNAMTDRKHALALWLDLYVKTYENEEKHFQNGQTLHRYMDIMNKANQQLIKLAELVDRAREEKQREENESIINHFFDKNNTSKPIKKK